MTTLCVCSGLRLDTKDHVLAYNTRFGPQQHGSECPRVSLKTHGFVCHEDRWISPTSIQKYSSVQTSSPSGGGDGCLSHTTGYLKRPADIPASFRASQLVSWTTCIHRGEPNRYLTANHDVFFFTLTKWFCLSHTLELSCCIYILERSHFSQCVFFFYGG